MYTEYSPLSIQIPLSQLHAPENKDYYLCVNIQRTPPWGEPLERLSWKSTGVFELQITAPVHLIWVLFQTQEIMDADWLVGL